MFGSALLASQDPPDPRALASLTVRDTLAVPAVRAGLPQVLAGHDNLDRPVRWVHAGEVSNMASLLTGGELLLTTGMGIGSRASEQRAFIGRLAATGVAALVVELGTTFQRMPEAMIEAASERELPLIALYREIPFVAVTEAVHSEIVSSHYALMRQGEQIRQRLRDLILDGSGIPEVLEALAATLRAPVFLESADGRLLSNASPAGYDLEPLDLWEGAGRAPDAAASYAASVRRGGGVGDGRLIAMDLRSPVQALAKIAIDHAADIIALALLRERHEEELVDRKRGQFLSQLADGRIAPATARRAAMAAGLTNLRELVLPIAADVHTAVTLTAGDWAGALHEIHQRALGDGVQLIVGRRETASRVLGLAVLPERGRRAITAATVANALRTVLGQRLAVERVVVVVGRPTPTEGAGDELRLTDKGAASAVVLEDRPWHDGGSLDLRCLLWGLRSDADLVAFVERSLGGLLEHDRQRKQPLLPTLEALLASGGRKAEAARALHLNRQALYQRLARIEQRLGVDLGDPECLLGLHVAVCARQYLDGAGT